MRKNITLGLCLLTAILLSIYSCRTDEEYLKNKDETAQSKKFSVFTSKENKPVNYADGFRTLLERHDEINGEQHTVKAMKNALSKSSDVSGEYVEFNIRSQDIIVHENDRYILFPFIKNYKVEGIVAAILKDDETKVDFVKVDLQSDYYQKILEQFKEQYQKSTSQNKSANKGVDGPCGFPGAPPCDIDVVIITIGNPPNPDDGWDGFPPGGSISSGECSKFQDCINNDFLNGGGTNNPTDSTKTPCEKMKTQTNNSTFKGNITTLEGKTGDDYENGFRISNSGQNQLLQNKPGTRQVDLKAFSNTVTLMHSHYDGLYPMFSPGDIIFFNQWISWAQNWNSVPANTPKIPLNNLTFTLVTSNGNYSFNFDGSSATPFPNYSIKELEDLDKDYKDNLDKATTIGNISGNVTYDMEKLEKEFLKFMQKEMTMSGLKLYRNTDNGNTELSLNTNGSLKETNCP